MAGEMARGPRPRPSPRKVTMAPCPSFLAGVLAACFLFAGCAQVPIRLPVTVAPQTPLPQRSLELGPTTVAYLSELEPVRSSAGNGPVLGLHFSSETGALQAVYGASGTLVRWDLRSRSILSEYVLGIRAGDSLRFDASGSMLLGVMTSTAGSQDELGADHYLSGVGIWDTLSGETLYCVVRPCDEGPSDDAPSQYPSLSIGADMDRAGTWALDYSSTAISFDDLRSNDRGQTLLLEDPDHSLRIASVALDPTGARYAIAFRHGSVTVRRRWIDPFGSLLAITLPGDVDEDLAVSDMRFSNDGRYLAAIRGEDLRVWKLGPLTGSEVIGESIPGALLVQFNATDDLLAVATSDSILIFDLPEGSLAASITAPDLTSIAFDTANYLLLWGDRQGVVHLLQVDPGHAMNYSLGPGEP